MTNRCCLAADAAHAQVGVAHAAATVAAEAAAAVLLNVRTVATLAYECAELSR